MGSGPDAAHLQLVLVETCERQGWNGAGPGRLFHVPPTASMSAGSDGALRPWPVRDMESVSKNCRRCAGLFTQHAGQVAFVCETSGGGHKRKVVLAASESLKSISRTESHPVTRNGATS